MYTTDSIKDPCVGRIMIDGIDIAAVGVHTLRQNLAIIPQDWQFIISLLLRKLHRDASSSWVVAV